MPTLNGTPMGPGFFMLFNIQDTAPGFKGFQRIHEFADPRTDDEEVLELITVILMSGILDGRIN